LKYGLDAAHPADASLVRVADSVVVAAGIPDASDLDA
jgi:hypothetical protein